VKKGREADARRVLSRVGGERQAEGELVEIREAIAAEGGSLAQLFQPGMRIVLVIGIALAVLQQITGINVFLYYAPEIFKEISGESIDVALLQTIVVGSVNVLFTVIAIWSVDRIGRKPLMLVGFVGMGVSLGAMAAGSWFEKTGDWLLLPILGYIASFAMSVGPVTWVILSEIFPTRIRGRAMAIATFCLWIANYVITQTFPMMEHLHQAAPFSLYAVFCVISVWFVWRFVPETKGRSLEEIERYWSRS